MNITHLGVAYTLKDPATTSPSAQSAFQTCPGIDWWKAVAGVREESSPAQELGIATAALVERYLKGQMTRDQVARDPAVVDKIRPADLALAALAHLPAPLAPRVRVEEWLALGWNNPEGLPRIAMKPDVLILPLLEGVHAPAARGEGGSGLFWVPPPFGVVAVEDVKTAKGYGWSLTEETLPQDTQMIWYALAAMRQENADRARLGQPQVDKKTRTARAVRTMVTREHAERVFEGTEALQREMQAVRAIRDPAELARAGALRWDKCSNIYGRQCPNFDRCAALKPSARANDNQPRMTLGELARLTGRHERGGSDMAQGDLGRRLFGGKDGGSSVLSAAAEIREKLSRDPGTLNPPDGPEPAPTPDQEMGIDAWVTGGQGAGTYWVASGNRHGTSWNAYGMAKSFKFFTPAWKTGDKHEPRERVEGAFGSMDVVAARGVVGAALARWDAEKGLTAALAPAGWYTTVEDDGGPYYLAGEPPRAGSAVHLYSSENATTATLETTVALWTMVEPTAAPVTLPADVPEDLPEDEDDLPGDPDDADMEAADADELPEDDAPEPEETPAASDLPDVGDAIAAAVQASATPDPDPRQTAYDVQAWQQRFADAGFPDWASRRIPAELMVTLDQLAADPEGLMRKMPRVGDGKIAAIVSVLKARGLAAQAPAPVKPAPVETTRPETAPAETIVTLVPMASTHDGRTSTDLAEEANNNPFLQKIGEQLVVAQAEIERLRQHTLVLDENRAMLSEGLTTKHKRILDLERQLEDRKRQAGNPAGYVLLLNVKPIPGGLAPLDARLLEDVLAGHIEAACQRLRVPSLELDPKAFGNPYKELVRELEDHPPAPETALIVDPFSNIWKGVREWFLARRAYVLTS